jgi:hypothetical protein
MRSTTDDRIEDHLRGCSGCSGFARRLGLAQEILQEHHGQHQPDAYFAQRVTATLPETPDMLGWAAMRLLPATLAAALVLSVWCWVATPGPGLLVEESPTDDLLVWVMEEDGS